jgi:pimeloyl-ACP methyl ester carboxylesterase
VYVAAFATDLGENLDAINNRYEPSEGAQAITSRDGEYLIVLPDRFPDVFAADIDAREASVLAAVQKPTAIASFAAQAGQPGFRALPSWYLISDEDRMIDPRAQEFMAQRAGSQTRHVGSSHASPVSHPHEVTDIILAALG